MPKSKVISLEERAKDEERSFLANLLKEDFQAFWDYVSTVWAAKLLDQWCAQVMRSRLEPMKKVAKTIRAHKQLILIGSRQETRFLWELSKAKIIRQKW